MNNSMIRVGSIGSGMRGRIAKQAHRPDDGFTLAMICDINDQVISEYREQFGESLAVSNDWRQVVTHPDLDAIFITTPDYLHEEPAIAALEAGKYVYLEKPMAITVEGCDRILAAARENGSRLYVGHNMRFFPVMRKMKQLIDQGTIGQVQAVWCRHFIDYGGDAYFKDWHSEQRYANGLLLQKGAHDIDIIHWLAGGYTQRTVGMGKLSVYNQIKHRRPAAQKHVVKFDTDNWPPLTQTNISPIVDVEDHSMMLMQLNNGVQASYTQCHYAPDGQRNYTIIGTQGRIENIGDHSTDRSSAEIHVWTRRVGREIHDHDTITVPPLTGSHGGADPLTINDFLKFVTTGKCEGATPLDARMSVAAGLMATQSIRQNHMPFDIPAVRSEPAVTTSF